MFETSTRSQFVVIGAPAGLSTGVQYSVREFPLHVTLLPSFTAVPNADVVSVIEQLAAATAPFTVQGKETARFGPAANIRVMTVFQEPARQLHQWLLKAAADRGWRLREPEYSGSGFVPHVTATVRDQLNAGAVLRVDSLAVVELAEVPTVRGVSALTGTPSDRAGVGDGPGIESR